MRVEKRYLSRTLFHLLRLLWKANGLDSIMLNYGRQRIRHRTHSVDFLMVLEGEVTLVLENGEAKVLHVHDTVVQKGNVHAWHNHGEVDCVIACVMIGAE